MRHDILTSLQDGIRAIELLTLEENVHFIEQAAEALYQCFKKGGKVLLAGNGGSLCDAMHFGEELTGLYRKKRPALGAIALADPGHMSCVANDLGYDQVFSRGIEALGKAEDVFVAMTTSGNSQNLIKAVEVAKLKGLYTIAFLGKTGGALKGMCDLEMIIDGGFIYSDRIQEAHMTAIHTLIEMVEKKCFPGLVS
ncbi:MAG: SIS domain-containing protein [Chlamydiota bacterium]